MKHQSKAEQALNKKLKEVNARIEEETKMLEGQRIIIKTLGEIRDGLAASIKLLYDARKEASEKAHNSQR